VNKPTAGPFAGSGFRLGKSTNSDKPRATSTTSASTAIESVNSSRPTCIEDLPPVVPDENYHPGQLEFIRYNYKSLSVLKEELQTQTKNESAAKNTPKALPESGQNWHRLR
jgi:hypothetical protein